MPQIIPVVIGLAASAAASIGGAAGIAGTIASAIGVNFITASVVAGVIGTVVSTVASIAMSAIMKPKKAAAATPQGLAEDRKITIRGGIEARQVIYGRVKVGGAMVYSASSGPDQRDLHLVVVLAGHPCDAVESVFLNDEEIVYATQLTGAEVTGGRFAGVLSIRTYLGGQTEADTTLVAESPDGWGSDHVLRGCTYIAMRLRYDQDKFPNGVQSIAAIVRGKNDIYDPRTASSGYSTNWALCVLDYLRGEYGLGCESDELDLPFFSAAANLSDEAVQLNEAATEFQPRYTLNGAFKLDQAPMDIIEKMLAAGAGTLVYVQGQYRLYGGAYSTPTVSLGPSDFAGDVELETRAPRRELFNSVRGTFIDPDRSWQAAEFPPLVDAGFVTEDGEQIWRDLPLEMITNGWRAQRLARIALLTARDSLRLKAPVRYAGLRLAVWQTVSLNLPDFGWTAKPFRIESWNFEPATGRVMLNLREENAANYAWYWDSGAVIPPSPNTTLVDPLTLPAITGLTVTPGTVLQPDGGILPVLDIAWTASAHPFVTAHEVQWSLPAEEWVGQDVRMPSTRHTVRSVQAGEDYRVRVRPVAGLVRGPWSGSTVATSAPDTTAPGTPSALAATGVIRGVALRWTNPTAPDFGKVEIEEGSTATGPWAKIGETPSDFFLRSNLSPSSSAWFRVRALDRSGNASAYSAAVQGTASYLLTTDFRRAIDETAPTASAIAPVLLINSTSAPGAEDDVALNLTDKRLYKRVGGTWVPMVNTADLDGLIGDAQISDVDAAKLAGEIVAAQIADGAITAPKIVAGAVTTAKLAVASTNLIWNSCATADLAGWTFFASGGVSAPVARALPVGDIYRLAPLGSGNFYSASAMGASDFMLLFWDALPVTPLGRYQAQALVQAIGCGVGLQMEFRDASGSVVGTVTSAVTTASSGGGWREDQYTRLTLLADAPATAVTGRLFISAFGNGGAPYVVWSKAGFGPAPPNATEVGPWEPGGVTQISGGQVVARTILADRIATNSLTAGEINADAVFGNEGVFNSLRAGIGSFGGLRAAEIATGQLRAIHMASETVIAETAQVANLIIGTEKITPGSMSAVAAVSAASSASIGVSSGTYTMSSLVQLDLSVPSGEQGHMVICYDANFAAIREWVEIGGGGDGGGGGGSGE